MLIADLGGWYEAGYWGEIMSHAALNRRLGGVVLDGCARDGALLAKLGFPVFSRGLCMRGTAKDQQARGGINLPIRIADTFVSPGDLIVGDGDGVVVLPREEVAAILDNADAREQKEAKIIRQLAAGRTTLELYGWQMTPE